MMLYKTYFEHIGTTSLQGKKIMGYVAYWTFAIYFFALIRYAGHSDQLRNPMDNVSKLDAVELLILCLFTGIGSGCLMWGLDRTFDLISSRFSSYRSYIIIKSIIYFVGFFLSFSFISLSYFYLKYPDFQYKLWSSSLYSTSIIVLMIYVYLMVIIATACKQILRKVGPRYFAKWVISSFQEPMEFQKLFMFLDLDNSSFLAERLGHLRYSAFIKDFFEDLDGVLSEKVEVFQYIGDEVVLCWDYENRGEVKECISIFFAFRSLIKKRSFHYLSSYGVVPEFKAGIHTGKVMLTEVGKFKKDLAYHGDAINTAAAVHDLCKDHGASLLVTGSIIDKINDPISFKFSLVGLFRLKSKISKIPIYKIETV